MKKAALTTLQVVITLGILFIVFRDPEKRAVMAHALAHADKRWLLAGIVVYGLVELVAGIRWQLLLRIQAIHLSWVRVFKLLLIGVFFNFFIPGGTGGDVVKSFFLLKETPTQRSQALLSVLFDRVVGLVSLIAIAGIFIATQWTWLMNAPNTGKPVLTALAILAGSFGAVGFSFLLTGLGLVHKLPRRFPGRDKLAELALAYNLYASAWRPMLAAFFLSAVAHFGYFGTFYCAARSFHSTGVRLPTVAELCAIMPVINTIAAMPISIGGIGVREGLFEIFLSELAGVPGAIAVVISSTGYLLTLTWGVVGGIIYLFYRPSEHVRLREIRAQMATLEHSVAEDEVALELADEEKR